MSAPCSSSGWRARAATRSSAPRSKTPATARSGRWSSRATATRPRRSIASPSSAAVSGLPVERLRPSQARRLEPALAPTIRLALDIEADHSIDPRKLVAALARVVEPRRAHVTGLRVEGERVTGVITERRRGWSGRGRRRRGRPRREARDAGARPRARAARQGPGAAAARRRRPRRAHDPRRARLPRPARRRRVHPRRDDGGARLGHGADRRRRLRAAARPVRDRARHLRARDRGAHRGPAPGHARQPAGDRPGRARRPDLGHRPLPQRDPAHAGHRRPRRRRAERRADARVGGARRPARGSRRCPHEGRR